MLARRATECPERVLQPFGQRDIALAAENDVSVLKARAGQAKVIQAVFQRDTRHGDAQAVHLGEVGQPQATGLVYLTEHDVTLLAMECAPVANTPLECAAHVAREVGMAPKHLVQYGHRPDAGSGLEQRDDLGFEDRGQGIGPAAPAGRLLLRWQSPVLFDAIARGGAEPGARSRLSWPFLESVLHVEPHLMVVDVSAGQLQPPLYMEELFIPDLPRPPTRLPDDGGLLGAAWRQRFRATPFTAAATPVLSS